MVVEGDEAVGLNWAFRLQMPPGARAEDVGQAGMLLLLLAAGTRVNWELEGACVKTEEAGVAAVPMLVSVMGRIGLGEPTWVRPKL